MSECKHEFIFLGMGDMHRCKKCGLMADSFTAIIFQNERLEKAELKENELQAQVAVLRKGMEVIADTTSHKRAVQLAIRFVATTPADAAERVNALVGALEWIEKTTQDTGAQDAASDALDGWRCGK